MKLVKNFRAWIARRNRINKTIRELSSLTNYELQDLGIHRSQINSIANETADVKRYSKFNVEVNSNLEGSV